MYQLQQNDFAITRLSDNSCIPINPNNSDYQEYQVWLAEGNQPLAPGNEAKPTPQDQIDEIERQTMVPRVVRESLLAFAQLLAQQQAAVSGKSVRSEERRVGKEDR